MIKFSSFMQRQTGCGYFLQNYAKVVPYVRPYWGRALLAITLSIPAGAMDAVIAWALKPYMDVVMVGQNTRLAFYIPFLIILFSLVQSLLNYFSTYLNTWVGQKISQDIKIKLFNKLMSYSASFFDRHHSGQIIYCFNNDVDTACSGLLNNLKLFTTRLFSSLALIAVLFYTSWQLGLFAVAVLLLAFYPLVNFRRRLKSLMTKNLFSSAEMLTHYNETFNGNRVISSYNLYNYQSERFQTTLRHIFHYGIKMIQRAGMLSPLMHFIVSLGIAGVIWLGSFMILHRQITPGAFVSFITALIMLYNPIKSIGGSFSAIQQSLVSMERVFALLNDVPAITSRPGAQPLTGIKKVIEYRDVCFAYNPDKEVLKNINLQIKVGETIAFVGNSGGGKTTLVNLLPRFYDVASGGIYIDGTDIRTLELNSLRDNIAIVLQDNFLFSGTIRENIVLGKQNVTAQELENVLANSCLKDFVASLKDGLETQIGERGVLLSGGQKQRIAIARALLKDAPLVILDEATSALDNRSEEVVAQAIANLMKLRTVLIIAHRLSTVRNANKIIVVNDGKIVESGTHSELIKIHDSIYASLYHTQLK